MSTGSLFETLFQLAAGFATLKGYQSKEGGIPDKTSGDAVTKNYLAPSSITKINATMSGKPAFDPNIHLLRPKGKADDECEPPERGRWSSGAPSSGIVGEVSRLPQVAATDLNKGGGELVDNEDEAYARLLQEELNLQAKRERHMENAASDEAIARRMQSEESPESGSGRDTGDSSSGRHRPRGSQRTSSDGKVAMPERTKTRAKSDSTELSTSARNRQQQMSGRRNEPKQFKNPPNGQAQSEALARRLMKEQVEDDNFRRSGSPDHGTYDEDEAFARRLQKEGSYRVPLSSQKLSQNNPLRQSLQLDSLLDGNKDEDDETLARRFFERSLAEMGLDSPPSNPDVKKRLSNIDEPSSNINPTLTSPLKGRTDTDEALARKIMECSLAEMREAQGLSNKDEPSSNINPTLTTKKNEDLELAQRMQNLETMGMGRMNSLRQYKDVADRGEKGGGDEVVPSSGNDYEQILRLTQEKEDELLARTIADNDISSERVKKINYHHSVPSISNPLGVVGGGNDPTPSRSKQRFHSRKSTIGGGGGNGPLLAPEPKSDSIVNRSRGKGTGKVGGGEGRGKGVGPLDPFPVPSLIPITSPKTPNLSLTHNPVPPASFGATGQQGPKRVQRRGSGVMGMGNVRNLPDPLPSNLYAEVTLVQQPPSTIDKKKKKKSRHLMGGGLLGKFIHRGGSQESLGTDTSSNGKTRDRDMVKESTPPPPSQRPGPLPHSISINRTLPMSPQPKQHGSSRDNTTTLENESIPKYLSPHSSHQASLFKCDVCGQAALSFLSTLDKRYHPECFKCMGCHEIIDPSGPFAFTMGTDGERHPLHRKCYAELFGIKCAVCKESIPSGPDGKVSYVKHPFFDTEQMCPKHAKNPGRRCTGCHRFEPIGNGFADLGDAGRCVCLSCCRSVVVDSDDAKPLWAKVIRFFEVELGLPIWPAMKDVPILVVGYDALNEQIQNSAHNGSSQIMTRGLCLSEHQSGRRIALHRMRFNRNNKSFTPSDAEAQGYTYFQVPDASKINPHSSITAILCMSGLPSDLTASILAHEATHAWIKLHPNFDVTKPIPLKVEEGCCQLMAYLFLGSGLDPANTKSDESGPSDEKLRQYFKFSIETDENEIYGQGYRTAAKAFAHLGIEALMSHVVMYREFPEV